jgi:hypothetical protein
VTLQRTCDIRGASEQLPAAPDVSSYVRFRELSERRSGTYYHVFEGGCITYDFSFEDDDYELGSFGDELARNLSFMPRQRLADAVERDLGIPLDE